VRTSNNQQTSGDDDEGRWQKTVYNEKKWQQDSQNKADRRPKSHQTRTDPEMELSPGAGPSNRRSKSNKTRTGPEMELSPRAGTSNRRSNSPAPRRSQSRKYSSSD
jgi:hypothetical protein